MAYNYTPTPQYGVPDPFGLVPGVIQPPNPYADLSAVYPNLAGTNADISSAIGAQVGGRLSPGTLRAMQDYEAGFAARSGMPGTNAIPGTIGYNRGVRDVGLTAEQQVNQGLRNYQSLIPTIAQTQTLSPQMQAEIAATNAMNAAAPNPNIAQTYAQNLLNWWMQQMRSPAGGTGRYAPAVPRSTGGANLMGYNPWQTMDAFHRETQAAQNDAWTYKPYRPYSSSMFPAPPTTATGTPSDPYGTLSTNGFTYDPSTGAWFGGSGMPYSSDEIFGDQMYGSTPLQPSDSLGGASWEDPFYQDWSNAGVYDLPIDTFLGGF